MKSDHCYFFHFPYFLIEDFGIFFQPHITICSFLWIHVTVTLNITYLYRNKFIYSMIRKRLNLFLFLGFYYRKYLCTYECWSRVVFVYKLKLCKSFVRKYWIHKFSWKKRNKQSQWQLLYGWLACEVFFYFLHQDITVLL